MRALRGTAWFVLSIVAAAGAVAAPETALVRPGRDFTLKLAEFAFDPATGEPQLPQGWERSESSVPDLHLVQLRGAVRAEGLERIATRGFEIVQYVYPHTYIVWGRRAERVALESEGIVRWTGDFAPAYRVQPQWRQLDDAPRDVKMLLYRGADTDAVVEAITALGATLGGRRPIHDRLEIAAFRLPGGRIRSAARVPGVYSIRLQPKDGGLRSEMSSQINVNNVDGTNLAFPGYDSWLTSVGLDGSGVVVADVDGGIYDTHPDLVNRMLPCTGDTCGASASSHGTMTSAIIAGDASSGTLDSFGFLRGLGVAPGANLIEQNYSPTFTQAGGMLLLMTDSFQNGAALSGNSWGPAGTPQGYDDDTLQVDVGVRDADPATPGNQPLTYVLSIMNGYGDNGAGNGTQGSPDEAKNIFTIGSTKMQNFSGSQILAIDDISANSAHGPCLDGRLIPHMVAPGCYVDAPNSGTGYGLDCGTSFASPQVSGAVALFFEYYRSLPDYTVDPSPALVKAAFLSVARDLSGSLDAEGGLLAHPFDRKQGWGRMNLPAVVDPPADSVRYFDALLLDDTGAEWSQTLSPLDPGQPVRIMLVWTDAPGHGLGGSTPAWNNDLDLIVEVGSDTYLGNSFGPGGNSVTGGSADFMNNTEGVFLDPAPAGDMTVRVVASDINSDGVPNVGDATDQDFALVCYNCALEPGFTLAAGSGSQAVCAPDSASYTIDVGSILGFTDPVTLSASGVPAGASSSFTVNPVTPESSTMLTVDDTDGAPPGDYVLTVEGTSGSLIRSIDLALRIDGAAPAGATLLSPADGATGVSAQPLFGWSAIADALSYQLEVSADPGFASLAYSFSGGATSHLAESALDALTTYSWRVRASNGCGAGAYSAIFSFTTLDVPTLLLVDDDDNGPDVRGSYTSALAALGVAYDVWDTANSGTEPSSAQLAPYEQVIWFTGDEWGGAAGPGVGGAAALASWLDDSACLLISSQDYHYDRSLTPFMQSHLGVASVTNDVTQTTASGQGSVFGGLGPYTLSFPYTNYTDSVTFDATAASAFEGSVGTVGVSKDNDLYRTAFWSFGVEAVPDAVERQAVLSDFLGWCATLPDADGDSDGVPNGDDCTPGDPGVWASPTTARDLSVERDAPDNLSWSPPAAPGSASVVYDVLRSDAADDFAAAICVDSDLPGTSATDGAEPAEGGVFHYLVRVRNGCGANVGPSRPPAPTCP